MLMAIGAQVCPLWRQDCWPLHPALERLELGMEPPQRADRCPLPGTKPSLCCERAAEHLAPELRPQPPSLGTCGAAPSMTPAPQALSLLQPGPLA